MKILIIGHDSFQNKGCQALILTTTSLLKRVYPDVRFKIFSWDPEYDKNRYINDGIDCHFLRHNFSAGEFSFRNRTWINLRLKLGIKIEKGLYVPQYFYDALGWADLVVVSGGDILADYGENAIKHYFFPIAIGAALGKPVYIFAQSISRYKNKKLEKFCKYYFDKTALITVREKISYDYMQELHVKAPLYLTADPAFLLSPCGAGRVREIFEEEGVRSNGGLRIGLSVSRTATHHGSSDHGHFVGEMASAMDALAGRHENIRFLFVPHVTYRNDPKNDDRLVGHEIREKTSCKDRVDLIQGDYGCDELKAIIGACDVFVGARTHATIAAISQFVPTIAIAYSIKAFGIMSEFFDEEECLLSASELSAGRVVEMIENICTKKAQYMNKIKLKMPDIRELAAKNGDLIRSILK